MLERIPKGPTRIMDQACGTGILTMKIARRFPRCRVIGVDVTEEYLRIARKKTVRLGLSNVEFILGRAEDVLLDGPFDCITSSYLAKYTELPILVNHAGKMLRDDGILIMHDFTYPPGRTFARIWEFYFRLLQTVGAWKYPEWRAAFDGLPELLRRTEWMEHLPQLLQENGFSEVTMESLTLGTCAIITGKKTR